MKEMKLPFIDSELLYIHVPLNADSDLGLGLSCITVNECLISCS